MYFRPGPGMMRGEGRKAPAQRRKNMKDILLFYLPGCPHCKLALRFQEELLAEHPAWKDIPFQMVDESREAALADTYDYYYVPTYYVGGQKVHEGHAEKCDVEKVFRLAAEG